ncbi:hypothetical protein [Pannonibacter indicus]|uniref:hypothetical protein n=1 Tax=Pannonibacter indicus TaxID=466044 RepID=UPI00391D82C7
MTPEKFTEAYLLLQERGIIPNGHGSKKALAELLGMHPRTVGDMLQFGTKQLQTDYAIAALLAGLAPYGENPPAQGELSPNPKT